MKICKFCIPFCFIILTSPIKSQMVNIRGSGTGYNGIELRFFSQSDPVTRRLKPLLRINCDDNSSFSCDIPCKGLELVYIKTGIFSFYLYASEGLKYDLHLPDFIAKPGNEGLNPFFRETKLIPEVINNPQDINNLIRLFDTDYNPVFNLVAGRVFTNSGKDEIPVYVEKLKKYSELKYPKFFNDYVKCRMTMLYLITMSSVSEQIKIANFIDENFLYENPAYLDLIEQLFSGYFKNIISGHLTDSVNRAIAASSFGELKSLVLKDGKITHSELAEYVILFNLFNDYHTLSLPGKNVIDIISSMKSEASSVFIKDLASEVLTNLLASLPGNYPPGFSFMDSDGRFVSPENFRGKYSILSFARSDNRSSFMEFGILNMWHNKYANDLQIITILTDRDYRSALNKMKNAGFDWTFLDGSSADSLEYLYEIKMYPSFLFLDREGKIIADPCPYPSEDLEQMISKTLQKEINRSGSENR